MFRLLAPTTTACSIQCASGVPDYDSCTCFACGSDDYNQQVAKLKEIKQSILETGQTTDQITKDVATIQAAIDELTKYCQDNKGDLDQAYISGRLKYIRDKITGLTTTVQAFKSDLAANTACKKPCKANYVQSSKDCSCSCPIQCNELEGMMTDYNLCQCREFPPIKTLNETETNMSSVRRRIQKNFVHSEKVQDFIYRWYDADHNREVLRSNLEYKFDMLDKDEQGRLIEEINKTATAYVTEYDTWWEQNGKCPTTCSGSKSVQCADCKCYTTDAATQYNTFASEYITIESKILDYDGKGDKAELGAFEKRSYEIRQDWETLTTYIRGNCVGSDAAYIKAELLKIQTKYKQLSTDFDEWVKVNNPSNKCLLDAAPPCAANNQIKNTGQDVCKCIVIENWEKLPDVVNSIDAMRKRILALDVNDKARNTLLSNLDQIEKGIPALKQYAEDQRANLDVLFVQSRTDELLSWFSKLNADVTSIENADRSDVCTATCPNTRWIYNNNECSCTCEVTSCKDPQQKVDYYNCKCADTTDCAKTQAQCDADGGKILDYAYCTCKPKP